MTPAEKSFVVLIVLLTIHSALDRWIAAQHERQQDNPPEEVHQWMT